MEGIVANTRLGKVTLVGAGPGDPDYMTIKGVKALKQAGVILYDALVNPKILDDAPQGCELVFVGKRFNNHAYSQQKINRMLIDFAIQGKNVVRLKGGDCFVFGRGSEEIEYVSSFGIETEIIAGVSSALAVPSGQGIPLTKRSVNESFWVITGTTSSGNISKDLHYGARSSATIVVLMGLRNISLILHQVKKYRDYNTPFAIVQNGSLPNEAIFLGTIGNASEAVKKIDYASPGIIVIGDTVAEHHAYFEEEIQRVIGLTL